MLLDEALRDFVDAEPRDATLALLDDHPRLLIFRTFSKAWGLAGLRCGYAVGGPGAEPLLEQLAPELGLNELAQAGALEALRTGEALVAGRAARRRRRAPPPDRGAARAAAWRSPAEPGQRPLAAGRGVDGASWPTASSARACSSPRAGRSAIPATCAPACATAPPATACSRRSETRSRARAVPSGG